MRTWESHDKGGYIFVYKMVLGGLGCRKVCSHHFFLNSSLKYEQFYGVILCLLCCFHTFNSFLGIFAGSRPTFVFIFLFLKFSSVSGNTVISFRSKKAWDLFFVFFVFFLFSFWGVGGGGLILDILNDSPEEDWTVQRRIFKCTTLL